jgi:ABC-type nitrate/sulfonate/bicarbonate transport system permease component
MGWLAWDSGASLRPYIAGFSLALVACALIALLCIHSRSAFHYQGQNGDEDEGENSRDSEK